MKNILLLACVFLVLPAASRAADMTVKRDDSNFTAGTPPVGAAGNNMTATRTARQSSGTYSSTGTATGPDGKTRSYQHTIAPSGTLATGSSDAATATGDYSSDSYAGFRGRVQHRMGMNE